MIKTVWIKNLSGNVLELNLRSSDREVGLLIFNITGLGPPKATVSGAGGPNFDGIRASSVRTDARHLLMTLVVQGVISEEEAKQKVYTFFPIKQEIVIGITTDMKDVYISAIVESNEFNQFASVENAVISLFCPDPYFLDVRSQRVLISPDRAIPLFEFPFENDSLTIDRLEFGYIAFLPTADIVYSGEVRTGVDLNLNMLGYVEDVVITNTNGSQQMTLDFTGAETYFGSAVQASDQVFINTRSGKKSIYFVRAGVWYNMINGVGIDDDWIDLRPVTNTIIINATTGIDNVETEIEFRALNEGV